MRVALLAGLLALALGTHAQPAKLPRVGVLQNGTATLSGHLTEAFVKGLAEHGYVNGRNVLVEVRYAESKLDRLPALAKELDARGLDVFFTPSALATHAVRKAGMRAPMIFALVPDPVGAGFAQTLSRPGGNLTGMTSLSTDIAAKRIEVLRETLPALARVAVLHGEPFPGNGLQMQLAEAERAMSVLGKATLAVEAKRLEDLAVAFAQIVRWRADALLLIDNPLFFNNRGAIAALAEKHRLPTICTSKEFVESGCLMSYGSNYVDLVRRAAGHAARILKGAKPGELPIEQPVKFELVINLKTAKSLGLAIPRQLLLRADQVID